jgi:EpsI family protein
MTKQVLGAVAASGLLAATLLAVQVDQRRTPDTLAAPLSSIPNQIGEWTLDHSEVLAPDILNGLHATSYISRVYHRGSLPLDFFVAFYAMQEAGETLHTPKNCLPGNGWEIQTTGSANLITGDRSVRVNEFTIRGEQNRAVVLYWYQTHDRVIANEYLGKMYLFWDALTRGRKSASAVRVVVPDIPGAAAAGEEFAVRVLPEVQRVLGH